MSTINMLERLTASDLPASQRRGALRDFADEFGWRPSDAMEEYQGVEDLANGHLVIEHGLDNTAVITFLKADQPLHTLDHRTHLKLLSISYNNLVNWHLFPDTQGVTAVLNLAKPIIPKRYSVFEKPDVWRAESFDTLTHGHPAATLKNLDQALIETISHWKRAIAADVGHAAQTANISALFNAIIFVRALEDYRRSQAPNAGRAMLDIWGRSSGPARTIRECIRASLAALGEGASEFPPDVIDMNLLEPFDGLDDEMIAELLQDFYNNRFAPYQYDFSLMSKHALSRIYEKYVALLREDVSDQRTFFPDLPEEYIDRSLGAVYTPQYIARFFGRFLRDNLPPREFRRLRILDPACGSGMFLRTILEMQCDPFGAERMREEDISAAFRQLVGIDIDPNACHATRLSLSLLHLVLTGRFPARLQIEAADAIGYFTSHPEMAAAFEAAVTNPPFIKWDRMPKEWLKRVEGFMGQFGRGKTDMALAHLKLGLEALRPGGFLLYVLPHSFLLARNALALRRHIATQYWVRVVVDLSEVEVFGDVGSYVILLVVQAPPEAGNGTAPKATLARCRELPGRALCDTLEGRSAEGEMYSVYEVEQQWFQQDEWIVFSPTESRLQAKVFANRPLDDFLAVRQGFVSGADDVFIRDRASIPNSELGIYAPFLSDRDMTRYHAPTTTDQVVFYPYIKGELADEETLAKRFPETWHYLQANRQKLLGRASVKRQDFPWWRPERPRPPGALLRPKIMSPHLVVMPRFSVDLEGKYAVSHCPLMYPQFGGGETELLKYFVAVLNSPIAFWQISRLSHKYSRGYAMLEAKTLKKLAVPDPSTVDTRTMAAIQRLVTQRVREPDNLAVEKRIEELVATLYNLSDDDRVLVGMEA